MATDMTHYNNTGVTTGITVFDLLSKQETVARFELACGKEAGSVMINIINAVNANPDIAKCDPMSVINAGLNAAALKLSLSKSLGQACIVVFDKRVKNKSGEWETKSSTAELILMARGYKHLAMRTNKYRVLNDFFVYDGQSWEENQLTGIGAPVGAIRDKSKIIGYGAYLLLFTGYEATV